MLTLAPLSTKPRPPTRETYIGTRLFGRPTGFADGRDWGFGVSANFAGHLPRLHCCDCAFDDCRG